MLAFRPRVCHHPDERRRECRRRSPPVTRRWSRPPSARSKPFRSRTRSSCTAATTPCWSIFATRASCEREGKIPGAFHCPRGMLEFWIDPESPYHKPQFAEDKRFVFFCAGGWRSALAAQTAQRMGLKPVAHIRGGFGAWKKAGGPVEALGAQAKDRAKGLMQKLVWCRRSKASGRNMSVEAATARNRNHDRNAGRGAAPRLGVARGVAPGRDGNFRAGRFHRGLRSAHGAHHGRSAGRRARPVTGSSQSPGSRAVVTPAATARRGAARARPVRRAARTGRAARRNRRRRHPHRAARLQHRRLHPAVRTGRGAADRPLRRRAHARRSIRPSTARCAARAAPRGSRWSRPACRATRR